MMVQSTLARVASAQRTQQDMHALRDNVDKACALSADTAWDRKAAAHAEFHQLLAQATGASGYALLALFLGGSMEELIVRAGPAAEGLIIASRRRVLGHLDSRDAEGAAREMEAHMTLLYQQVPDLVEG
jgi:DNA-binding FadR family transcriptional regulator